MLLHKEPPRFLGVPGNQRQTLLTMDVALDDPKAEFDATPPGHVVVVVLPLLLPLLLVAVAQLLVLVVVLVLVLRTCQIVFLGYLEDAS